MMTWGFAPGYQNSVPLRGTRSACLSTSKNIASKKAPLRQPASTASPSQNPSYPAFSFQGPGANRTIKVVVVACLTVIATIESIFWVKVLWTKISPASEIESKQEGS